MGKSLRFLYPDAYGMLLPFTLEHLAMEARPWRFDARIFTFDPSVSNLLVSFLESLHVPREYDPAEKMLVYAEGLRQRLNADNTERPLGGAIKGGFLKFLSGHFRLLSAALDSIEDASPTWQEDVQELQQAIAGKLADPPDLSADQEMRLRRGILRYADAIAGWNKLFEYCRTQAS
ncbi:MAG: hypothetical protein ABFS30_17950 [Pseudomonadota bacterium]